MVKFVVLLNMNGPSEKANNILKQDILFYDHECIMCSHFIGFIYELHPTLVFSKINSKHYENLNLNPTIDSVVFYFSGNVYIKSDAVLMLFLHSNSRKWRLFAAIFKWAPKWIRNFLYDIIAKYRKQISKLFFKNNYCNISIKKVD